MKGYDWSTRCGDMILAVHDVEQFKQGQSFFLLKPHEVKKVTTDKNITIWNSMQRHASDLDNVVALLKSVDSERGDYIHALTPNAYKSPNDSELELGSINGVAVVAFWGEDDGQHFRELVITIKQLTEALEALNELKLHLSAI
ncbi:hypothetical protein OTK49_20750 [Vibrio coralliirubri]|uniref:hypothetical protein n=1 Tax=Vibrio coralliirubri TaxID=1516159 RepID=UPI002283EB9C|nr:hypothetical protein [Vibrio coralliirubri]MCY9864948.1 hypothetical protein [Vibrio coralliirubri]